MVLALRRILDFWNDTQKFDGDQLWERNLVLILLSGAVGLATVIAVGILHGCNLGAQELNNVVAAESCLQ